MALNTNKYLTFTLGDEMFAIPIASVREIQDLSHITRIPQAPGYMRGVVNLRGSAVPVLDLKHKLCAEATERTINTRIIIIEKRDENGVTLLGALADSVKEVLEIDREQIDAPPRMGTRVRTDYLQGIARLSEAFILVMDIARVFSADEVAEVAGAADAVETEAEEAA